jgi:hypothetical protein
MEMMRVSSEQESQMLIEARVITKSLADIIEVEIGKIDGLQADMQGMVYQYLASWLLGSSQMIATILEVPVRKRDALFNLCMQDSLMITDELLGNHKLKQ